MVKREGRITSNRPGTLLGLCFRQAWDRYTIDRASHTDDGALVLTSPLKKPWVFSYIAAACFYVEQLSVTSELLFEQYQVPSVAYAIDSLMSLYQNNLPVDGTLYQTDGLVISFNTASTSVIPVLNGKGLLSHAKRCAEANLKQWHSWVKLEFHGAPRRLLNTY